MLVRVVGVCVFWVGLVVLWIVVWWDWFWCYDDFSMCGVIVCGGLWVI